MKTKPKKNYDRSFIFLIAAAALLMLISTPANPASAGTSPLKTTQTPLPNPLRFPLPTPRPIPASAWRAPLYPVPWSLSKYDHFFFIRPIAADKVSWPSAAYRYGADNFAPGVPHTGSDIVVPKGTPVLATAPGYVTWADYGLFAGGYYRDDPYGIAIAIEHNFGFNGQPLYTAYAHLSKALVRKGDWVETGDVIGLSGQSGNVTAPHLHYEVRMGENSYFSSYNPELWMVPAIGNGVLAGRLVTSMAIPATSLQIRVTNLETNQRWYPFTYATEELIHSDPYYNENFVLGDLPAGKYEIFVPYVGYEYRETITIYPGVVNFFGFRGYRGINFNFPLVIIPQPLKPTPTPIQE